MFNSLYHMKMKCDGCELSKKLFLYAKDNLIYSLCQSCLKVQDQIDELNRYKRTINDN